MRTGWGSVCWFEKGRRRKASGMGQNGKRVEEERGELGEWAARSPYGGHSMQGGVAVGG